MNKPLEIKRILKAPFEEKGQLEHSIQLFLSACEATFKIKKEEAIFVNSKTKSRTISYDFKEFKIKFKCYKQAFGYTINVHTHNSYAINTITSLIDELLIFYSKEELLNEVYTKDCFLYKNIPHLVYGTITGDIVDEDVVYLLKQALQSDNEKILESVIWSIAFYKHYVEHLKQILKSLDVEKHPSIKDPLSYLEEYEAFWKITWYNHIPPIPLK